MLDQAQFEEVSWREQRAEVEAWEQAHREEWERVDRKLRGVAARRAALDAEEARLLRYAEELKLWRGFGYGSLLEYMERAMGYAPRTAMDRLRVARALPELPLVAEALESGALAHSAVRELSRVAIAETEADWLEAAQGKSLREIEAMVSGHKAGDLPTDPTEPRLYRRTLTLEVSPETYDIWRRLHALAAEEHGQRLSDDELIPALYRRAYSDTAKSSSPAYKLAIKQCPDCKRAFQYTGGRDVEIDPAVAECAACDAVHLGSLDAVAPERTTTTVTPRKREQILARDGHSCVVPGCRRNIGLDLHHIEYQSHGGGHDLSNLVTLCDLHHRALHFNRLVISGTAPDRLSFEFLALRDRRNVTDDDVHAVAAHARTTAARAPLFQVQEAPGRRAHVDARPSARAHVDAQPTASANSPGSTIQGQEAPGRRAHVDAQPSARTHVDTQPWARAHVDAQPTASADAPGSTVQVQEPPGRRAHVDARPSARAPRGRPGGQF